MNSDHEAKAKALLPCEFIDTDFPCGPTSLEKCCSCERRPAVAAALAETYNTAINAGVNALNDMQAELTQLRAELAEAEKQRDGWWKENEALDEQNTILHRQLIEAEQDRINIEKVAGDRWTKLKAERDAAYVKGLERAKDCVDQEPEYPGQMPDEMWLAMKNDKDAAAQTMRISVRLTKSNILEAIQAEIDKAKK